MVARLLFATANPRNRTLPNPGLVRHLTIDIRSFFVTIGFDLWVWWSAFYVVPRLAALPPSLPSEKPIRIVERSPREITHIQEVQVALEGMEVSNPVFRVTLACISAIITRGIVKEPNEVRLRKLIQPNLR